MTPERYRQIDQIFQTALGLEPELRDAYLDKECRGDEKLRKEVDSLLTSDQVEGLSFIDAPAFDMAALVLASDEPAFAAGDRIDRYEVLSLLGSGGMGEVYLAHDKKLNRTIALKLLPSYLTHNQERLWRFQQEARAASALNHPNILTIHELGEADGQQFIATEFVEGETLRERLSRSSLSLDETLEIAIQVTSALAAAHKAGIVHRDIKPENIMLRPDGYVKVLDFGLAKLTEQPHELTRHAASTTERLDFSSAAVMGTVKYMSPEQALGQPVDSRSDIFSFGIVLYEMLAGHSPFEGETPRHVIVAIQEKEPDPLVTQCATVPVVLQRIVSKALAKERSERYKSAEDLLLDLKNLTRELESGNELEEAKKPRHRLRDKPARAVKRKALSTTGLIWIAVFVAAVGVGRAAWLYFSPSTLKPSLPPMKVVPFASFPGNDIFPAFSPDGKNIAFSWSGEKDDNFDIYVKQVEGGTPLRLTTHSAHEFAPVWSPDGAYIAFSRNSEIYIIPALGGLERKVYSAKWDDLQLTCIDWSPDGKYLALPEKGSPQEPFSIFLLSLETLEARKLTSPPEPRSDGDRYPIFSPDGRTLAFVRNSSVATQDIYVVPVAGGEPRRLTFDNTTLSRMDWTPDGTEIIFPSMRGGANLMRLWRVSVASGAAPEPLAVGAEETFDLAISPQGDRLAYAKASFGNDDIWRIEISNATGRGSSPTKLIASTRDDFNPRYSPDGRTIAFGSSRSGSGEIWKCDSDGSNPVQLTNFGGPILGSPSWSHDGRQIVFDSRPEGYSQIYVIEAEGGQPRRITTGDSDDTDPNWSRDGKWIYFHSNRGGQDRIWKVPAEGGQAVPVTGRARYWGVESPDGKFFYYEVDDAGVWTIWRIPTEGGQPSPVVKLGETWGNWAVTEQGIYFNNADARPDPDIQFYSFATGRTQQVTAIGKKAGYPGFHVSSDGRWIIYSQLEGSFSSDIMLVENFR